MSNDRLKAHIAVLTGNFFFGISVVAVKYLTPSVMPPLALNVLRVSIALSLFWLMLLFKPSKATIRKKDIPLFILCAATGIAINQILFIQGTSMTSAIHAALLSLGTPIAITAIAAWLLKEKITLNKTTGLILGISGATILILIKTTTDKDSNMLGDIFIIINAISYAFYLVLVQPLMANYKPEHVIRWVFLFGAFMIVPLGFNDALTIQWEMFLWYHWLSLIFVVIGSTFLAYLFMVYGVDKLGATITGTYIYTQPVFATITSMILFNEKLTFIKILSAILIFVGVYLVNKKKQV
ncbi:MAG: DMT family transporter [Chitinophagaceae bacterium]|nr:DMT family transporter [Chitinophagaceae bacterium]MCW5906026.1 DMT family transporter [Chitinophagaceae bacterium]